MNPNLIFSNNWLLLIHRLAEKESEAGLFDVLGTAGGSQFGTTTTKLGEGWEYANCFHIQILLSCISLMKILIWFIRRLVGKDNETPFVVVVGHDTIDGKATDKKPGEG